MGDVSVVPSIPPVLWISGPDPGADLAIARRLIGGMTQVVDAVSPERAVADPPAPLADRSPLVILLASREAACWKLDDSVTVSRRWPLAPVISVAGSLVEGRRRSGPALPGIEEIAWTDLPGRLAWWLLDRAAGVPGTAGLPATARRDERILEAARRIAESPPRQPARIEVAATRSLDAEGLADVVRAAGHRVVGRRVGRPPLDHDADAVVWDAGDVDSTQITWLSMVAANRPTAPVVLLDSFPRSDTATAALGAGAAAILARPVALDILSGVLLHLTSPAARRTRL